MPFYNDLGYLVFGSRLRRLSEAFLADVNKIYQSLGIPFDASWFPVFYILSKQKEVSIRAIADELGISHSAASQLLSSLQQKGLITVTPSATDARKKVIRFSREGKKLQSRIEPVWNSLTQAMQSVAEEKKHSRHILKALGELEESLVRESLYNRVHTIIK